MMKKKLFALLLSAATVLLLLMPAFAVEENTLTTTPATTTTPTTPTYTITINNSAADHNYAAYQIFTGDLSGTTLSNIQWGSGVTADGQEALGSAADRAKELEGNTSAAQTFATEVAEYLDTGSGTSTYDSSKSCYTISGLAAGYYLIKETGTLGSEVNDANSAYILKVSADETVTPKSGVPTVTLQVEDVNDSTDATGAWDSTADHDIGDDVNFLLTVELPNHFTSYGTYQITVHNQLGAGLTLAEDLSDSLTVKWETTAQDAKVSYSVVMNKDMDDDTKDGCAFHVVLTGLEGSKLQNNDKITISYKATLSGTVVIGGSGNQNTAWLTYSNDPNNAKSLGKTTDAVASVFTYKLEVSKVNELNQALEGAGFTLYKYDVGAATTTRELDASKYKAVGKEVTGGTTFTWTGLDDGYYKLEETTTPAGYNTMEPLEFKIEATHGADSDGGFVVTELSGMVNTESSQTFTADTTKGTLTTTVFNYTGATLPSTGGRGTTILYVLGAILVIGAGSLLVTRKRMETKD